MGWHNIMELLTAGMHDIMIDMHMLIWQNSVWIMQLAKAVENVAKKMGYTALHDKQKEAILSFLRGETSLCLSDWEWKELVL